MKDSTFTWATVTATGPLRIKLDGDTSQLPHTPESLLDPAALTVADRVRCEISANRVVIIGRSGGDSAAAAALINVAVPVGKIEWYSGSAAPSAAWLVCDGSAVSRTTYAALFAIIGTSFGAGNGSTTFNLPNLAGRLPVGVQAAISVGTVTFTNATDLVNRTAHGLVDGDRVYITGGSMPTGLTASTRYYVRDSTANTFKLATTRGGAAINFTTDGSGTRTLFVENFPLALAEGEAAHQSTYLESASGFVNIRRFDGDANDYLAGSGNAYGIDANYTPGGTEYTIGWYGGGDRPHNNLPPYLVLTPIIKALAA